MTAKRRRNDGKILDLLKSLTFLAQLDRFLPNFACRRTEATDMFWMSLTLELDAKWQHSRHLEFTKIFNISGTT